MNEAGIIKQLHDIAVELKRIRRELQRIAPRETELPDLETFFEQLEDDHK